MIASLQQHWSRLSERERRMVTIGAAAVLALFVLAVVLPLQRSVSSSQVRVQQKRDDLLWLRSMAPQLINLRGSSERPQLHDSLVVVIDRTARQSGVQKNLSNSQPSGDGGLSVHLEQISFDTLIAWLSQLRETYGIGVDNATIDATGAPGIVNASLVLHAR